MVNEKEVDFESEAKIRSPPKFENPDRAFDNQDQMNEQEELEKEQVSSEAPVVHRVLCCLLLLAVCLHAKVEATLFSTSTAHYSYTVEPLIMDTLKSGQPPYNGQTVCPLPIYCPYISTSEEGTTSEQWTKCLSPTCPLFGGSTVVFSVFSWPFLYLAYLLQWNLRIMDKLGTSILSIVQRLSLLQR